MEQQSEVVITTSLQIKELSTKVDEIKTHLDDLKKNYQIKKPPKYVTRNYVADEILHCDISTVHNLTVKGILKKYGCGGRVLYILEEVENAIIALKR